MIKCINNKIVILFWILTILFMEGCRQHKVANISERKKHIHDKQHALKKLRSQMADKKTHLHWSLRRGYNKEKIKGYQQKLQKDGRFADINLDSYQLKKYNAGYQKKISRNVLEALTRIQYLSQSWLDKQNNKDQQLKEKLFKSIIYYSDKEVNRIDGWFRFYESCFKIPALACGIYFMFYNELNDAENGNSNNLLAKQVSEALQKLAKQTFTQPHRKDTDNSVDVKQFTKSPHWVNGNFTYRPLCQTAAVCSNEKMLDVISSVCLKVQPRLSWNSSKNAFWNEGMTADGAGWGHGSQCYVWGYPLDALAGLLDIAYLLKETPWKTYDNHFIGDISDYIDAMSWYQWYQQRSLMSPGRHGLRAGTESSREKMDFLARKIFQFKIPEKNATKINTILNDMESGRVTDTGTRSFWNNDDIIKKSRDYYLGISMMSSRTISNEVVKGTSTHTDNFGDGTTFIMTHPGEYKWAKGFWNYTALPGTTLRQSELQPHTIWAGYAGIENFAANVSDGMVGCAGFISGKQKKKSPNSCLFDVRAVKGYFLFEDEFVALGNSIQNKSNSQKGDIWTTLDQSEWRKNLYVNTRGKLSEIKTGSTCLENIDLAKSKSTPWVLEDGVGYIIL